jgi:hypothetical protein
MQDTQIEEQVEQIDKDTEEEQIVDSEPEDDGIQIPDDWEPDVKDFVNGISDKAGKKAVFDKIKNLSDGYMKKYQELATQRKQFDTDKQAFEGNKSLFDGYSGFDKSIAPEMRNAILGQYGSVPAYMTALYNMDMMASRDPRSFLINYCNNNGITAENLNEFLTGREYQQAQQTTSQEELKKQILQEIKQEQAQKQMIDTVTAFVNEVDEQGQPKHPLLSDEAFVADMDALQRAFPNKSLEELYQMTVNMRPDLRQKSIEEEARKIEEAKDVEKAKRALGVHTQTPVNRAKPDKSWADVLDEQIDSLPDD